jgi:kinesin family protein 5
MNQSDTRKCQPYAREEDATSAAEVMKLLDEGESARAVANHKLNATSSRSHAILILRVANAGGGEGEGGKVTRGKLMLVDLAGSERTTKTGSAGNTQKEAQAINQSLTSLGRCIQMLAAGGGGHIPYRDSKLTRLLSDSLGGSALTSLIATVGPLREHYSETAATLKFAQQALKVENTLKVGLSVQVEYSSPIA